MNDSPNNAQGNDALENLRLHDRFARKMANKFTTHFAVRNAIPIELARKMVFEDLLAAARLAIVAASKSFDASRGNKFLTYAAWRILGALQQEMARMDEVGPSFDGAVRNERYAQKQKEEAGGECRPMRQRFENEHKGATFDAIIGMTAVEEEVDEQTFFNMVMEVLPKRSVEILRMRMFEGLSLGEISERVGIVRQNISPILKYIMKRVKKLAIEKQDILPFRLTEEDKNHVVEHLYNFTKERKWNTSKKVASSK